MIRQVCVSTIAVLFFSALHSGATADDSRQVNDGVIDASVADVWDVFTTKKGLEACVVAQAEIELKVGGRMQTHYNPKGKLGDEGSIENTIISFDPQRMLSIKIAKAPKGFPFPNAAKNTWSVLYFESLGPKQTRLTVVGLGYGSDDESQKMRKFFDQGNGYTIRKIQEYFAKMNKQP